MTTVNDREWAFLAEQTGEPGPFNDMYFKFLRDLGYTGTLQDMIAAYGAGFTPSRGNYYDDDSTALFGRFTTEPTPTRKQAINSLIVSLKDAGVWTKLDVLHVFAAANAQGSLLNWKGSFSDATTVSSPTFTADRGYTTNGTSSYLNMNFNPSVGTHQYLLNSASFGFWSRTTGQQAGVDIGGPNGSGALGRARNATDQVQARVNDGTTSTMGTNTNGSGLFTFTRPNSSVKRAYRNSTQIGTDTAVTSTVLPIGLVIGQFGGSNFSARQYSLAFAGASLTATDVANFYAATLAYMQAVGAA